MSFQSRPPLLPIFLLAVTVWGVFAAIPARAAVPADPTSLSAVAMSQTRIDLSWTDNSVDETGFRIERSPDGMSGWVTIDTNPADDMTYSDTGLNCNTTYHYRVLAANVDGDSGYSNSASATTGSCPVPDVVLFGNSQPIASGDTTPSVTDHTAFGSAILGQVVSHTFTIYNTGTADLDLTGTPKVSLSGPGGFGVTTSPVSPVIAGGTSTFIVSFSPIAAGVQTTTVSLTSNDPDESLYTFDLQGTGTNQAPSADAGIDQTVVARSAVTLNGSSSDPDGHNLSYGWSQTGGQTVSLSSSGVDSPTFTAPGQAGVLTFTLHVTDAYNLASLAPDEVVITVQADTAPPTFTDTTTALIAPTAGAILDTNQPTFDWADASDNAGIAYYTLIVSSDGDVDLQGIDAVTTTVSQFTPTQNLPNGNYTWLVTAHDLSANISPAAGPATFGLSTTSSIYLPIVLKNYSDIDLVIDSVSAAGSSVSVTVRNAGGADISQSFWVQVYFDPSPAPPTLNQSWQAIAPAGAIWNVTGTLAAGASLTLTRDGTYYQSDLSSPTFPAAAQVYAYADAINHNTTYGSVLETNENNNVYGPVVSTAEVRLKKQLSETRRYCNSDKYY